MTIKEQLQQHRQEILETAVKHGASNIRFVGDNVPYRNSGDRKIYFLVKMEQGRSLLDHGGLLMDLQELLDGEVRVLTENGLRKDERDRILSEAVAI